MLSILLALATGATLSQTVDLATTPITGIAQSDETARVVYAFYEAANRVLR
jgi:hypothetical protein